MFFTIMPCTVLAKEKKHTCIKLIVKEHKGLEGSVKEVINSPYAKLAKCT